MNGREAPGHAVQMSVVFAVLLSACDGGPNATPAPVSTPRLAASPPTTASIPGGLVVAAPGAILPTSFVNKSGVSLAYFTMIGRNPDDLTDPRWYRVNATGQFVVMRSTDDGDYNIPFPSGATPFPLPLVRAGRIYVSLGNKMVMQVAPDNTWLAPNGWSNSKDPNYDTAWDWVEINYVKSADSGKPGMGVNTTAVQMFGLPMTLTLTDRSGSKTKTSGFKKVARQDIMKGLVDDPKFKALVVKGVNQKTAPLRAVSLDNGVRNFVNKVPGVPAFDPSDYDSYIADVWKRYGREDLSIVTSDFGTYAGRVNARRQMVFRQTDKARPNQKPVTVSYPAPADVIIGDGALVGDCPAPPPNPITDDYRACGEIGSTLSAAFNRSTLLMQSRLERNPPCGRSYLEQFYQSRPVNLYAKLIHGNALPNLPDAPSGGAYAFGYDDNCNQSSLISDLENPSAMSITVGPF